MREALKGWIAVRRTPFAIVAALFVVGGVLFAVGTWMSVSYPAASDRFPMRFLQMTGLAIIFDGGARWRLRRLLDDLENFIGRETGS